MTNDVHQAGSISPGIAQAAAHQPSEPPDASKGAAVDSPETVTREYLHRLAAATRDVMLTALYSVNTCIITTRVAIAALERLGVPAKPMPVFVTVQNREAYRLANQGIPMENWPVAAWSVGVDERSPLLGTKGGWNGHLVLVTRAPGEDRARLLIDVTADQFDRPIRNLVIGGPVFMGIPAGAVWTPKDPLFTVVGERTNPDAIISYRPMPPGLPEAERWRQTPDWETPDEVVDAFAANILERVATYDDDREVDTVGAAAQAVVSHH